MLYCDRAVVCLQIGVRNGLAKSRENFLKIRGLIFVNLQTSSKVDLQDEEDLSLSKSALKRLAKAAREIDRPNLYGRALEEAQAVYWGELQLISKQWGLFRAGDESWKWRTTRRLSALYPGWQGDRASARRVA